MEWIGPGVLRVDGKDYGYGDTIPTKGISPERIAQFKKLGKIGEVPVAGPNPEIVRLNTKIADLEATAKTVQEGGRKLEAECKRLAADNAILEGKLKRLKDLKSVPPASKVPTEDGAGPTPDKKGPQK